MSTEFKKELFVFDCVAPPLASQLEIYRMIGQEAVASSLEVFPTLPRATTVASLPMGRLAPARPTPLWVTSLC